MLKPWTHHQPHSTEVEETRKSRILPVASPPETAPEALFSGYGHTLPNSPRAQVRTLKQEFPGKEGTKNISVAYSGFWKSISGINLEGRSLLECSPEL